MKRLLSLPLALLTACGGSPEPAAPQAPAPEPAPAEEEADLSPEDEPAADTDAGRAAEAPLERDDRPLELDEPTTAPPAKGGGAQTVIFMVLDTVRADHMSLCGYERPTTPWLEALTKRQTVSHTCRAYSPGTWTVPSHASYFTGRTVPEHESDSMGLTFGTDMPTLAEIMREKGYQSVMVTANPTLSERSGLQRGFEHIIKAPDLKAMRAEEVPKAVRRVLERDVDPDKPLFLFVNILDAHDPYPAVPPGLDWVPAQPEVPFDVFDKEQNSEYHKFIRYELEEERQKKYLREIRNGYDYGISQADRTASMVLTFLRREGWLENGFRFVLTSDHGEFLGEHQLLRHGCYAWEPVVNVPFVYYDTKLKKPLKLPEPFSALNAFHLVSEGRLPDEPVPVASFSKHRALDVKICADMVALWPDMTQKLVWFYGDSYLFDLVEDPREMGRIPLPQRHPARPVLDAFARSHEAHLERVRNLEVDEDRVKELEALGYIQ